jgi:hypothetical protein
LRLQFRNNQKNFTFKLNSFRNVLVLVLVLDARVSSTRTSTAFG